MKKWKKFTGDKLPQNALDWAKDSNIWASRYGRWVIGFVWYQGETPETATDWIITMDDGSYFKVRAQYMLWHSYGSGKIGAQAIWSTSHLKKTTRNLRLKGDTLPDPGYQT